MYEQLEVVAAVRWQLALATEDIPAFGVVRVIDTDNEGIIIIARPDSECQFVYVCGEYMIPAGKYGLVTKDSPIYALVSEPAPVDVPFGPEPGSFALRINGIGWKGQGQSSYIEGRNYMRRWYVDPDELVLCKEFTKTDKNLGYWALGEHVNLWIIRPTANITLSGIVMQYPIGRKINIYNASDRYTVELKRREEDLWKNGSFRLPLPRLPWTSVLLKQKSGLTVVGIPADPYLNRIPLGLGADGIRRDEQKKPTDPFGKNVGTADPFSPVLHPAHPVEVHIPPPVVPYAFSIEEPVPTAGISVQVKPTTDVPKGVTVWDETNRTQYVNTDASTTWQAIGGASDGVTAITPGATENDLAISPFNRLVIANPAADSTISGFSTAGFTEPDGVSFQLFNISANTITLPHNVTSTAAYRIYTPHLQSIQIPQYSGVVLKYSNTLTRWVVAEMLPTPAIKGAGAPSGASAEGALWWDTTGKVLYAYSISAAAWMAIAGLNRSISEDTLAASQNNYTPASGWANTLRILATTAHIDITGFAAGADGKHFLLENSKASTKNIRLPHESSSSTAGNRVHVPNLYWHTLRPGESMELEYDGDISRFVPTNLPVDANIYDTPGGNPNDITPFDAIDGASYFPWYCPYERRYSEKLGEWVSSEGWYLDPAYETLGGSYNDYAITIKPRLVVATTSAVTFTGWDNPTDQNARKVNVFNAGTHTITYKDQSASSTAANRFSLPNSRDVVQQPGQGMIWEYLENGTNRWAPGVPTNEPLDSGAGAPAHTPPDATPYWDLTNNVLYVYDSGWIQATSSTVLPTLGTANQVIGVNAGGTALENKTVSAGTGISVTHSPGDIAIANTGLVTLTVRESDGSPSVATTILEVHKSHMTITDSGGGVALAKVRLSGAMRQAMARIHT